MILEPNCSIIAACLPCYGPLFVGGRAPESLIRSVRSVFSLRSQGSTKGWFASRTNVSTRRYDASLARGSESQVELTDTGANWSQDHDKGYRTDVRRYSGPDVKNAEPPQSPGIQITTKVDVISK